MEAEDAAAEAPPAEGAPATVAAEVGARRRASLLSQRAAATFEPAAFLALLPRCSSLRHSCVPNAQLEPAWPDAGGPLVATLVALRDVPAGEPLTIAWVDCAQPRAAREAALRARFGADYTCGCPRCRYEAAGPRPAVGAPPPWLLLARAATEEGRLVEAAALFRELIASLGDGAARRPLADAWHALGVVLLGRGAWGEARAAWRDGLAADASHPQLREQLAKDDAYAVAADGSAPPQRFSLDDFDARTVGGQRRIFGTRRPLLSADECAAAIAAAEAHAAAHGGWTTQRHYAVPTTDLPLHELPTTLAWFNGVMASRVAPMVAAQFGVGAAAVRVHDAFLVRYEAGAQALLPMHSDESEVSLTIALNPLGEYDGGGTYFADLREAVRPEQGHALAFDGSLFHGGEPIVRGVRYIIAAFLYTERAAAAGAPSEEPRGNGAALAAALSGGDGDGGGFSFGF